MTARRARHTIKATSVVVAAKNQVSSDLAGEAIVHSLQTGRYYGLDPVGAHIWGLLGTPTPVADIRDCIVRRFDVEPDRCERDVLTFVQGLADHELIEISDATAP